MDDQHLRPILKIKTSCGGSMSPELLGQLVNASIPFFGGVYATLLGFRVVGAKPGQSLKSDEWHARFGKLLKVLGPLLILFGLFSALIGFVAPPRPA